ncbi:MAG: aromatic amino acid ammonia-lyase [Casimicrobiaceae bacterium]
MKAASVAVGDRRLTLADVVRVAREGAKVELAPAARSRVEAGRATVDRLAHSPEPIYGVNTALGANTGARIPAADINAYQARAVEARAVGVGAPFPPDVVRAIMLARIAGMAMGGSGVSPPVLDALVALLDTSVHPVVPRTGSIGCADLPALSHLALVLIGKGAAEIGGNVVPGGDALARAGLTPAILGVKDGLALISANAATVGHAALVITDCARALDALDVAVALSFEGFRANLSPLDPRVHAARPEPGQVRIGARLRALLADSALWTPGAARRVQDPLSLRCVTQVHGAALTALSRARDVIELELNSASESPLVLAADDVMLSNGNFHPAALALDIDAVGLGLAAVALLCVQRCQRLYSPAMSGLPLQLTRRGPEHSGFATLQKTLTTLYGEMRHLANPASLDCLPVSEAIEDHASMAPNVVAKTEAMVTKLHYLAAIELLSAAQAVDLRETPVDSLGRGARHAYDAVRAHVAVLDEDRPLGPDVERIAQVIRDDGIGTVDLMAVDRLVDAE